MGKTQKATGTAFQVRVSANAQKNLDEITGYIAFIQQQPITAISVGERITATIQRISTYPTAYRECEQLPTKQKMYRRAVCLAWSIIFRITGYEVLILGIIHHKSRPSLLKALRSVK
jgi:plasmid stabilization system protein ParE